MRGEEGSAHWHRNAAGLLKQLFELADPQCLASREERASSLSESVTAFALAVRPPSLRPPLPELRERRSEELVL